MSSNKHLLQIDFICKFCSDQVSLAGLYSKSPDIRIDDFEMTPFMFLCDEVVPACSSRGGGSLHYPRPFRSCYYSYAFIMFGAYMKGVDHQTG